MKKSYIVIGVIIVIVIGIFMWFKGSYNQMVTRSENVSSQWSNVENQYQRRLDLIPNLGFKPSLASGSALALITLMA